MMNVNENITIVKNVVNEVVSIALDLFEKRTNVQGLTVISEVVVFKWQCWSRIRLK